MVSRSEEVLRQFLALVPSQRQGETARSGGPHTPPDPQQSITQPAASNNHPQSSSNHSPAEPPADSEWQLDAASVKQRAAELFPGGTATPNSKPRRPALVEKPTNELAMLVFEASKGIALIRGQLAREEVAGYLAADLLGIELLKEEALRLGESVRKAAAAAKDGDARLRNASAALKSKLKQKAQKDPELAADLPCKLQRLDSDLDVARAQLKQEPPKLNGLPEADTVIVERKPKPALTHLQHMQRAMRAPTIEMAQACEYAYIVEEAWRGLNGWVETPFDAQDPDHEEYQDDVAEVERKTLRYRHILERLWRACPAVAKMDVTPDQLAEGVRASVSNSQLCPCGSGLRVAFSPWIVHREAWGFCNRFVCDDASWYVMDRRDKMVSLAGYDLGWNVTGVMNT